MPNSLYHFANADLKTAGTQNATNCFGPQSADDFRLTSSFQITADVPAYMAVKGYVLLQPVPGKDELVNLILRPYEQIDDFNTIKYFIYRGLKKTDFLSSSVSGPLISAVVNTTGSEMINAMNTLQNNGASGIPIAIEALFGFDLAPAGTTAIDDFFFTDNATNSQLFLAEAGMHIGDFKSGESIGLDIIYANPEYFPDIAMAQQQFYEITGASGTSIAQKHLREQIRHFVDPAAFYGSYHQLSGGIGYRSGATTASANTKQEVYTHIVEAFHTKNKVYLDIRNENGYSYNYYDNYVGTDTVTPANNDKELKLGFTSGSLAFTEYYTDGWPIHIVDVPTPSTTAQENPVFLALRINDNEKPLLFAYQSDLSPVTLNDNGGIFVDDTDLLTSGSTDFTETLTLNLPNIPGTSGVQLASYFRLDYIKQIRLNDGPDGFPYQNYTDHLFGPIDLSIPWDAADRTQWISSHHRKYIDAINKGFVSGEMQKSITGLNATLKTITIAGTITEIDDSVEIINSTANTQNVGTYNVVKVNPTGGNTIVTVRETFPAALQTGDTLKFRAESLVTIDYNNKKLIARDINLMSIDAFDVGEKIWLYTVHRKSVRSRYTVASRVFTSNNTEIVLIETISKAGFGAMMETGVVIETDTTTSGSANKDRVLIYAVPQFYFRKSGVQDQRFFNYKGGVANSYDFFETIKKLAPNFNIESLSLETSPGNYTATLSYPENSSVRESLLLIGLTKVEWQSLLNTANAQLSSYHQKMFQLIPQGNRKRDEDYEIYYEFDVRVTGVDGLGNYSETTSSGVSVYSRDGLLFTSPTFVDKQTVDLLEAQDALNDFVTNNIFAGFDAITRNNSVVEKLYTSEEQRELYPDTNIPNASTKRWNRINSIGGDVKPFSSNNNLLNIDDEPVSGIASLILEFKDQLDLISPGDFTTFEAKCKEYGEELLTRARKRIKTAAYSKTYTDNTVSPVVTKTFTTKNKDAILYLARLKMQVILKYHPVVINNQAKRKEFSKLFELVSRGLEPTATTYPDFTTDENGNPVPAGARKILISGFDPFGAAFPNTDYFDEDGHESNPAGNIALALDGKVFSNDSNTKDAIVRSVIFPVRHEDFDASIVKKFFEPYISNNSVKVIITFSYGLHYFTTSDTANHPFLNHDFHIDRFAANYRTAATGNNSTSNVSAGIVIPTGQPFIENNLPYKTLRTVSGEFVKLNTFEISINHGSELPHPQYPDYRTTSFKLLAQKFIPASGGNPSSLEDFADHTDKYVVPAALTPFYSLENRNNNSLITLRKDSNEYRFADDTHTEYIEPPVWDKLKYPAFEADYKNTKIIAVNGSGGNYLSNEIHYRVAYLREAYQSSTMTGHIHVGFLNSQFDAHTSNDRDAMLADIEHLIRKFLDAL